MATKSLNYLKTHRAKAFEKYEHKGREIQYRPATMRAHSHYRVYPTNSNRPLSTKKQAIKYLSKGI